MSRSRKKVSVYSYTRSGSMKQWKRGANSKLRSKSKQILKHCQDWDELLIPHKDEVDNRYNSPMDGRPYVNWHKPDDNECIRDKYYRHWWRDLLYTDDGRHFINKEYCDCISNPNNRYRKQFRK